MHPGAVPPSTGVLGMADLQGSSPLAEVHHILTELRLGRGARHVLAANVHGAAPVVS